MTALDPGLAVLMLGLAVFAIAARDAFAAVVGYVAYGLVLALVWVRLDAVDAALTEAAIGGGLTGVLMLGATARLRATGASLEAERASPRVQAERASPRVRWLAALLSAAVAGALATGVILLPDPAPTLAHEAAAKVALTGLGNPVAGTLMAFRGMDTLLEKVVLVLALVAVWSLASDRVWGGRPGARREAEAQGALAFLARVLPPLGIVVGVYLVWVSSDEPGGAFQGGTLVAAMWLLVIMAGLADAPAVGRRGLRLALVAGPALFLAVGLGGLWLGEAFLAYPEAHAKALILAIEVAKTLTIAATLGLLMLGAPARAEER